MEDKSIYVKTYFRIESGYIWGEGHPEHLSNAFIGEIKQILSQLGFEYKEPENGHYCYEGFRGGENLYCHPQNLSGWLKEEGISEVESVIKNAKSFRWRYTDTYDRCFNYTSDELLRELIEKDAIIEDLILQAYKTPRSNLMKCYNFDLKTPINFIRDRLELKLLEEQYIKGKFLSLVEEGKIKTGKNKWGDTVYRSVETKAKPAKKKGKAELPIGL